MMDQLLHDKAKSGLPAGLISVEDDVYAVAVLRPDVVVDACSVDDIVWIKSRGRTTVGKVLQRSSAFFGKNVTLPILSSNSVTNQTQIRELNPWADYIVAFATKFTEVEGAPSQSTPSLQARAPLASLPVNEPSPLRNGYILPKQEHQDAPPPALGARLAPRSPAIASRPRGMFTD